MAAHHGVTQMDHGLQTALHLAIGAPIIMFVIWRWIYIPNRKVRWDRIHTLFENEEAIVRTEIPVPKGIASVNTRMSARLQFADGNGTVKYFRFSSRPGLTFETIQVIRHGSAGFSATFRDRQERPVNYQRVGGKRATYPRLKPDAIRALRFLMERVRAQADTTAE